jgi:mevalonate kinase
MNDSEDTNGTSADVGSETANSGAGKSVPEADFMALKRSSESTQVELGAKVTQLTRELDSLRTVEKTVENLKTELEEMTGKFNTSEAALSESKTALETAQSEVLSTRRNALLKLYNLPEEQVKNLDASQLQALEQVLPVAKVPSATGHDVSGSGGGGDGGELTAREKIKAALGTNSK